MSLLDVAPILIAGSGATLAVIIAVTQQLQFNEIKIIGRQTRATAEKLRTDTAVQDTVSRFFSLGDESFDHISCYFPVYYDWRPLPSIVAGDFYALSVLRTLIGNERLELATLSDGYPQQLTKDTVFLCAPPANEALKAFAPCLVDPGGDAEPLSPPKFADRDLPCWFADHEDPENSKKRIWVADQAKIYLESLADGEYAKSKGSATPYKTSRETITDRCILARVSIGDKKVVIIAGIHQYGTWIGGEFLRRLAEDSDSIPNSEHLLGSRDFVAVIHGEFSTARYDVASCQIELPYFWVYDEDGDWVRVERLLAATTANDPSPSSRRFGMFRAS
jgi:hypothetical protein